MKSSGYRPIAKFYSADWIGITETLYSNAYALAYEDSILSCNDLMAWLLGQQRYKPRS